MSLSEIGEIKECPHCKGSGTCKTLNDQYSCVACMHAAGITSGGVTTGLVCSACKGKGSVWIGPEIVKVPEDSSGNS